ncbi:MAG TPA: hypothetical protein VHH72_10365 [Solirubrobacterales bacterium]|jgi:hypothetical protein|nr:hypothetical protein [Solirubrobacterales bacterium]
MTPNEGFRIRKRRRSTDPDPRFEGLSLRLRGSALETRRRLRPARRGVGRVAPYLSEALLLLVRIPAALIAVLLDVTEGIAGWVRSRIGPVAAGFGARVAVAVTPLRTLTVVASAAAIALAASQFADFSGVAVGASEYNGDVRAIAPPPQTDLETAGSAHLYLGVPLAALALVLIVATARGRWRLGRAVALVGVAGIALSLIVDLPQGLDSGGASTEYFGTEAQLIEGFWSQLAASAVLVLCGPLLGTYTRQSATGDAVRPRRRALRSPRRIGRRRRAARRSVAVQAKART